MKFFILLIFLKVFLITNGAPRIRLLRVFCEISSKTIPQKPSCNIKTFKGQSYLSVRLNLSRTINDGLLNFACHHKKIDGFQKIIGIENVKICKIVSSMKTSSSNFSTGLNFNPLLVRVFEYIKTKADGNIFEACETVGNIFLNNLTFSGLPMLRIWPQGDYKADVLFHDKNDGKILNFTLLSRILQK